MSVNIDGFWESMFDEWEEINMIVQNMGTINGVGRQAISQPEANRHLREAVRIHEEAQATWA